MRRGRALTRALGALAAETIKLLPDIALQGVKLSQVDRQMRMLTQFWIHCQSISIFDKRMRRPKLHWKMIFWFNCADYQRWPNDPRAYGSYIKTRFAYSSKSEEGPLTYTDRQLFAVFDSFSPAPTAPPASPASRKRKIIQLNRKIVPDNLELNFLEQLADKRQYPCNYSITTGGDRRRKAIAEERRTACSSACAPEKET